MCEYNTGCPGHPVDDGFVPCESKETCASGATIPDTQQMGQDICVYCGADQGTINPETNMGWSRVGFDCYLCGSN